MAEQQSTAPSAAAAAVTTRAAAFEANVAKARAMSQGAAAPKPVAVATPHVAKEPDESNVAADDGADADGSESIPVDDTGSTAADDAGAEDRAVGSIDPAGALALLASGDLAAAIKALGGDPKLADTSDRKFASIREKETKLKRAEQAREAAHKRAVAELTKISQEAQAKLNEAHHVNSFVAGTRAAVEAKNWPEVARGLTALTKMSLADLTQKLASGKVGPTAEDKRLEADRAKLEADRAAFEAAKSKPAVEQQRATALEKMGTQLKDHPFLKVSKGFEARGKARLEKAFSLWEKSWDGSKFTKTPAQCANELNLELQEELKATGAGGPKPAAKAKRDAPPRAAPKGSDSKIIDKNSSFEARVAAAKRLTSLSGR